MNKFLQFLTVALTVLALPALSSAEQVIHEVQKGDTAYGIAKMYGTTVSSLKLVKPSRIYPGQKIVVFDMEKEAANVAKSVTPVRKIVPAANKKSLLSGPYLWKNPGREKFVGKDDVAFAKLNLTSEEIVELKKLIKDGTFEVLPICNGDKFDAMIFGKYKIRKDVIVAWRKNHCEAARMYQLSSGKEIWMPFICRNWAPRSNKDPIPDILKGLIPITPAVTEGGIPPAPVSTPEVVSNGDTDHEILDLIMGGGIYEDANGADHTGNYGWIKGRLFPWSLKLDDDLTLDTGVVAFYATGGGNDSGYEYNWSEPAIGPAFRLTGDGWDGNLDLMYAWLYNDGNIGLYSSEQKDNAFIMSLHYNDYRRRQQNMLWWPKWEGNLEYRHILNSKIDANWNGSALAIEPSNNNAAELTITPYIYDFNLDNGVRISPLIDFGLGYENGNDSYGRFMPGFEVSINDTDVMKVGALGYKSGFDSGNDQISWFAITLDLGGMWKVYRSQQIGNVDRSELTPRLAE